MSYLWNRQYKLTRINNIHDILKTVTTKYLAIEDDKGLTEQMVESVWNYRTQGRESPIT
jgi:hypothetical protein